MKNDNEKRTIYIKSGDTAESISSAIFEKVNQGYGTMYINVNGKEEFTLLSPVKIQPDEKKLDLLGWNEEQFKIDIKTAASIVFQKLTEKTMDFSKGYRKGLNIMAFYKNDMITAKENDELAEWRASFKENCNCARAIDKALNDNYANNRLDTDKALDTVLAEYGTDRVIHVLAAQVVNHDWDGRYHKDVKEWAKEQTKDLSADFMEDSRDYYLNAHPILIDGLATKVIQRGFEMGNFLSDPEKMYDFKILSKEEFLASYSYLTEAEYDNTVKEVAIEIHNFYDEFTDEIMEEMSVEDIVAEMENDGVPATLENYIGDIKDWQKSFEGELSHKEIEASNDLLRFLSLPETEGKEKANKNNIERD